MFKYGSDKGLVCPLWALELIFRLRRRKPSVLSVCLVYHDVAVDVVVPVHMSQLLYGDAKVLVTGNGIKGVAYD